MKKIVVVLLMLLVAVALSQGEANDFKVEAAVRPVEVVTVETGSFTDSVVEAVYQNAPTDYGYVANFIIMNNWGETPTILRVNATIDLAEMPDYSPALAEPNSWTEEYRINRMPALGVRLKYPIRSGISPM